MPTRLKSHGTVSQEYVTDNDKNNWTHYHYTTEF